MKNIKRGSGIGENFYLSVAWYEDYEEFSILSPMAFPANPQWKQMLLFLILKESQRGMMIK